MTAWGVTNGTDGRCLENKDGALNWAASGKAFDNGCSSCQLTTNANIHCSCLSSDGKNSFDAAKDLSKLATTSFRVFSTETNAHYPADENVFSHNGYLGCFGFQGANCSRSS